jgi:hypothetical protein
VVPRPTGREWIVGVGAGALLGALILGIGGRVAMRGIALIQEWTPYFTLRGSVTVVVVGGLAGTGFALVLLALRAVGRLPGPAVWFIYWLVLAGISLRVLRPVDPDRLTVFPPLVIVFGLAQLVLAARLRRART